MRRLKLLLFIALMSMIPSELAADAAPLEKTESQKDQNPTDRAERPQREAVKEFIERDFG